MQERKKAGFKEIARMAGISMATVSRVANGAARVDPDIQKRVREAASKLGIDFDQRNKTKALAFLLSNRGMLHPFHSRILVGAEAYSAARGWDMLFLSFRYPTNVSWKELHLPRVIQRRDIVRAVMLAGTNSLNLIDLLTHKGITFVVLGNNVLDQGGSPDYDAVFYDDIQGAYEMTRYLQTLGHRDIWFVGNSYLPWAARCGLGYQRAMEEAGLLPRQSGIDSEDEKEAGYLATKSALARGEPMSAILGAADLVAQGAYKALRDCGLKIPGDVSVAGCSDTYGTFLHPPLTTIREFPEQLGKHMVEVALRRIEHPELPAQQIIIPTEMVKRESCRSLASGQESTTEGHSQAPPAMVRDSR